MRKIAWMLACAMVAGCGGGDDAPALELVGHNDLGARGMNAAMAIAGDYAYVGSRTDSEPILIVDISDPAAPAVVGAIGEPEQALIGMTSRELRAVPGRDLLVVLNFPCSTDIHACSRDTNQHGSSGVPEPDNLKLYDLSDPVAPALVATHTFGDALFVERTGHELFLWQDPADPARVLLYVTTPLGPPALQVLDVSDPTAIERIADYDVHRDTEIDDPVGADSLLHSVSVSDDGNRAYLSHLQAGLIAIDTSEIAAGAAEPAISLITPIEARIDYSPPEPGGPHGAVEVPGRNLVLVTDEVYPVPVAAGCPWGWARLIDYADPQSPRIASEFKVAENDAAQCGGDNGPERVTFTAHNQTVTENLALVTWHSAGLLALDLSDPANMTELARFSPEPLPAVAVEDPALGGNPVLMWSYPIIKDGLIYVVDIRNGLYVLRYAGPHADEVAQTGFREGNSNVR